MPNSFKKKKYSMYQMSLNQCNNVEKRETCNQFQGLLHRPLEQLQLQQAGLLLQQRVEFQFHLLTLLGSTVPFINSTTTVAASIAGELMLVELSAAASAVQSHL